MLDVLRAEHLKLARHRATWFLVWIYPIGLVLLWSVYMAWEFAEGRAAEIPEVPETAVSWARETAVAWGGPASGFGRYLLAAFAAVAFAGEYGWNTWKLIVPHRGRMALLAGKYLTVLALLYTALAITGALTVTLSWLGETILGEALPRGITPQMLLGAHAEAALSALPAVLLTLAYTALAAVLTRSTMAAVVIGVVVGTIEEVFGKFAPVFAVVAPDLISFLYHALPGYHLDNVRFWLSDGKALRVPFPDGVVALPWGASLTALSAWIGGLTALTFGVFRRQDLN